MCGQGLGYRAESASLQGKEGCQRLEGAAGQALSTLSACVRGTMLRKQRMEAGHSACYLRYVIYHHHRSLVKTAAPPAPSHSALMSATR